MATDVVVVLCTAPASHAEQLARTLVEERHCACVNVLPQGKSVYRWEGKVQTDDEHLLLCKTTVANSDGLRERLQELHPYDVPEVLVVPVTAGLPAYLQWVADSVEA